MYVCVSMHVCEKLCVIGSKFSLTNISMVKGQKNEDFFLTGPAPIRDV